MATLNYLGNPLLKGINVPFQFTKEQVEEFIKCSNNVQYFIENYIKILNVDKGLVLFKMYDFQKNMINIIDKERFVCAKVARQSGKCVSADTTIKIRNKKTGEIRKITIIEFYEMFKNKNE